MKICVLTSVHPINDTRVFLRECQFLLRMGHEVVVVTADDTPAPFDGMDIVRVRRSAGRLSRMTVVVARVLREALKIRADIFHFHDPELIPAALILRLLGRRVIYDVHEDYEQDLLLRPYLSKMWWRKIPKLVWYLERWAAVRMNAVVAATDYLAEKFRKANAKVVAIHNYPAIEEMQTALGRNQQATKGVCYVGNITRTRGILETIEGVALAGVEFELAGLFETSELRAEAMKMPQWRVVIERGQVARKDLPDIFRRRMAALVLFLPTPTLIVSEPLKLFEYMSAGIPVIVSDFPLWRAIVRAHDCGLCVDAADPQAIANAILELSRDPQRAAEMGVRGRKAVEHTYNWAIEAKRLEDLYKEILGITVPTST